MYTQTFTPLEWQVAAWKSRARVLLMHGGAGTGKSRLAAEKLHALCARYPESTGLVVRKFQASLRNSSLLDLEAAIGPNARFCVSNRRWEYDNGSILCWGGVADQKQREALKSIGLHGGVDWIWIEEANALSLEDFQVLMSRLRGTAAGWRQMILTTNPDHQNHWINRTLIEAKPEGTDVLFSRPRDNKTLDEDYHANLDALTGTQRDRLRDGLWVSAEGMVWPYDPEHLCDPFAIPAHWRRIRVVDFGFTNPLAALWMAMSPDGEIHIYRQFYKTQTLVGDFGDFVKRMEFDREPKGAGFEATVCDHDAEDRATLERAGFHTTPAHKAVRPGIEAVERRFANRDKRRIRIHRGGLCHDPDKALQKDHKPTSLVDELLGYKYPTSDAKKDGHPIKVNDHACDALRYGICYLDGIGDNLAAARALCTMG